MPEKDKKAEADNAHTGAAVVAGLIGSATLGLTAAAAIFIHVGTQFWGFEKYNRPPALFLATSVVWLAGMLFYPAPFIISKKAWAAIKRPWAKDENETLEEALMAGSIYKLLTTQFLLHVPAAIFTMIGHIVWYVSITDKADFKTIDGLLPPGASAQNMSTLNVLINLQVAEVFAFGVTFLLVMSEIGADAPVMVGKNLRSVADRGRNRYETLGTA